jgi:hypothetical protein
MLKMEMQNLRIPSLQLNPYFIKYPSKWENCKIGDKLTGFLNKHAGNKKG